MLRAILVLLMLVGTASAQSGSGVSFTSSGFGGAASSGACTDGVDCYCDTVSDPNLLFCEDYEDLDYYENTANDWVTAAGGAGDRALGSQWVDNYNNGVSGVVFQTGQPATPRLGVTCSPSGSVCGTKEYCSEAQGDVVDGLGVDCWQGNDSAAVDIQRSGDFNDELGTLSLSGGFGETSDIFAGRAHMAYRTAEGSGKTAGIVGDASWTAATEIGVTLAMAYSSNIGSASLIDDPYKHDEFGDYPYSEYWYAGNIGPGSNTTFPFRPWMFKALAVSEATCDAAVAAADVLVGSFDCNDVQMVYGATNGTGTNQYDQATDWPFGTWGCVQAHISGMGSSDVEIRIYFNEELIIHIDNLDGSVLYNQDYNAMVLNNYSNANQGLGETATTEAAYRYQDNYHIRQGAPVSCSSIGFQ